MEGKIPDQPSPGNEIPDLATFRDELRREVSDTQLFHKILAAVCLLSQYEAKAKMSIERGAASCFALTQIPPDEVNDELTRQFRLFWEAQVLAGKLAENELKVPWQDIPTWTTSELFLLRTYLIRASARETLLSEMAQGRPQSDARDWQELKDDGSSPPKKIQKGPSRRCRHWARGLCKLGSNCTFLHSGVAGVHVPCRHFVRTGSCSRGELCDFKHEPHFSYGVGMLDSPVARGSPFAMGFQGPAPVPVMPTGQFPSAVYASPLLSQSSIQQRIAAVGLANAQAVQAAANYAVMMRLPVVTPPLRPEFLAPSLSNPTRSVSSTSSSRCRHWENGSCRLGKTCGFLHDPSVPQKFRTKVCRHWEKGNCKLGEGCNFSHNPLP